MRPEEVSGSGGCGEGGGEEAGAAQADAAAARAQADHRLVRRHTLLVRTKSTAEPARIRELEGHASADEIEAFPLSWGPTSIGEERRRRKRRLRGWSVGFYRGRVETLLGLPVCGGVSFWDVVVWSFWEDQVALAGIGMKG